MEMVAVVRLSLPSTLPSASRDDFWVNYWQINGDRPLSLRDAPVSEEAVFREFGAHLAKKISETGKYRHVEIKVRGIRYGSIELLLAIIGGEELVTEMFWTLVEFYAPDAFNEAVGGHVPLQTHVTHGQASGVGGSAGQGVGRVLSAANAPLIALIFGAVIVVYLLMWRIDSLEKEYTALHLDHTALVGKLTDQNTVLTTGLLLKLGIALAPGAQAPHGAPSNATIQSPAETPATQPRPAQPTQVLPSPRSEPSTETSPPPKAGSSQQGEKRGKPD
jgi:hypothetical protein